MQKPIRRSIRRRSTTLNKILNRSTHCDVHASDELRNRLADARTVCVLTGAGISVESGLSTFRNPGGLWDRYRPEDLANEEAFRRDPALVQGWYMARRRQAKEAQPNAGHRALARLEEQVEDFLLVTQNVDGLHARAGSRRMVELHGNIVDEFCIECGKHAEEMPDTTEGLRTCTACDGFLRPGVVWFGEVLPVSAFNRAMQIASRSNVFLSVGTSAIVYPAAGLPLVAKENGAYVVEINVEPSALAHVMHEVLLGPAGIILPELVSAEKSGRNRSELESFA